MDSARLGNQLGAAGLSLGSFSSTVDLIRAVSSGLELWHRIGALESDVSYLKAELMLQKDILNSWEKDWYSSTGRSGSSAGRLRILRAHDQTVQNTLVRVREELRKLDPMTILDLDDRKAGISEKVGWLAGQRADAQNALGRVQSLLQGLYMILPRQSPHPEAQLVVSVLQNGSAGADGLIDQLMHASDGLSFFNSTCNLMQLRQSLDRDLEKRIKEFQHKIPDKSCKVPIPLDLVPEEGTSGTRSRKSEGAYEILVEWKEYALCQGQDAIRLNGRCENLAKMLQSEDKPEELLTLHCKGFFDDVENKRFGFILASPTTAGEDLVSLNQLLNKPPAEELPALDQRYQIAYSLGLALSVLFSIQWLHKGIRSHNILFRRRDHDVYWSRPYLVGFAYSREDKPNVLSEKLENSERFNVYRHPDAQFGTSASYRQTFDIYSFGVVLFEIATWNTAFSLWSRDHNAVAFRREICKPENQKRIAHRMGIDYCDAMLKCLDGTLEKSDEGVSKAFFIQVVEMLRRQLPF